MSRTSDIRQYMIAQYPYMSYNQMLKQVKCIQDEFIAETDKLTKGGDSHQLGLISDAYAQASFKIKSNIEFSALDSDATFTASNLNAFVQELEALTKINKEGQFYDMIIPRTGDVMYAFGNNLEDIANLNGAVYSYLTRRYNNRGRKGSTNDIKFRMKFTEGTVGEFWIKNIEFGNGLVSFKLGCEFEIIHNSFKSMYDFKIITPELGQAVKRVRDICQPVSKQDSLFTKLLNQVNESILDYSADGIHPELPRTLVMGISRLFTKQSAGEVAIKMGVYDFTFKREPAPGYCFIDVGLGDTIIYSTRHVSIVETYNDITNLSLPSIYSSQWVQDPMEFINEYVGDTFIESAVNELIKIRDGNLAKVVYVNSVKGLTIRAIGKEIEGKVYHKVEFSFDNLVCTSSRLFDLTNLKPIAKPEPVKEPKGFLTRLLSVFSW